MTLKATIVTAVDTAFSKLDSFLKTGSLVGKTVTGFDFTTGQTSSSSQTATKQFLEIKSEVLEDGSLSKELLFKERDFNPSLYSEITFGGETYRVAAVTAYEGVFVVEVRSS